jgi:hypothetical protein
VLGQVYGDDDFWLIRHAPNHGDRRAVRQAGQGVTAGMATV